MAAVAEIAGEQTAANTTTTTPTTANTTTTNNNENNEKNNNKLESMKSDSQFDVQKLVDMFTKLNPLAKEFFPSYYHQNGDDQNENFANNNKHSANDSFPRRRRNNYSQGRKRLNGRAFRAQREDSIRRTVYVSDIDQSITEERLAGLFSSCGQVVDCRVCGDPHSVLRFAFVEFADEYGARTALNLGGTMLGYYPVRVLPSKTAILPVNPTFLPRSEDEREMCSRTVYCTNIDKKVSQAEVKNFFEAACGEVTRLRLLGDNVHSTRIAFVEFAMAESAIIALNCSGMVLGSQPIRISPSKTPVRPRVTRPAMN
ncbi:polyadenylate-binding protein-interacting protein 9-like [Mangifera indica]|uniref:polyadenylate-binding protein-interacting protein 9-like n=1 Tax=Mangifera indica TaxID=29780 RepID=UPI001CFAB98F|nr:polyadenylate-binding protein-interacting protein 9-like [Mangifera indica]